MRCSADIRAVNWLKSVEDKDFKYFDQFLDVNVDLYLHRPPSDGLDARRLASRYEIKALAETMTLYGIEVQCEYTTGWIIGGDYDIRQYGGGGVYDIFIGGGNECP